MFKILRLFFDLKSHNPGLSRSEENGVVFNVVLLLALLNLDAAVACAKLNGRRRIPADRSA